MTNGDMIRSMNDEELAEFLDMISNENRSDYEPLGCSGCEDYYSIYYPECCRDCQWKYGMLAWVQKEIEE